MGSSLHQTNFVVPFAGQDFRIFDMDPQLYPGQRTPVLDDKEIQILGQRLGDDTEETRTVMKMRTLRSDALQPVLIDTSTLIFMTFIWKLGDDYILVPSSNVLTFEDIFSSEGGVLGPTTQQYIWTMLMPNSRPNSARYSSSRRRCPSMAQDFGTFNMDPPPYHGQSTPPPGYMMNYRYSERERHTEGDNAEETGTLVLDTGEEEDPEETASDGESPDF
ncbi:hypothetical protein Fmac_011765 [Flemingia macrophylla]|uniref:Uncharacterized protein n=1 Tax=Flemingia macrophylla TaxID=520843 RepID=A0ABD1MNC8_9FABA